MGNGIWSSRGKEKKEKEEGELEDASVRNTSIKGAVNLRILMYSTQ